MNGISDQLLFLLKAIRTSGPKPTITARMIWLWSAMMYDSYQYRQPTGGSIDPQYLPLAKSSILQGDALSNWVVNCAKWASYFLTKKIGQPAPDSIAIDGDYNNYIAWTTRMVTYYNARSADGSAINIQPPDIVALPAIYLSGLNPDNSPQDVNLLAEPESWHPIQTNSADPTTKQKFLGPEWGNVIGVLSSAEKQLCVETGEKYLPVDFNQVIAENDELIELYRHLTEEQKIIAEFWAGGPTTVSPPGIAALVAIIYIHCNKPDLETEVKLWPKLGGALFESSVVCWKIKRENMQPRPIQMIRRKGDLPVVNGMGQTVPARLWKPFQPDNAITPPFPDISSGHSTFSSSAATVMNEHFHTDIINMNGQTESVQILKLMSPLFNDYDDNDVFSLNSIFVRPGSCEIQPGLPTSGVQLNFDSFTQMASQAGMSRLYGGIHIMSSNNAGLNSGQVVGIKVCRLMNSRM